MRVSLVNGDEEVPIILTLRTYTFQQACYLGRHYWNYASIPSPQVSREEKGSFQLSAFSSRQLGSVYSVNLEGFSTAQRQTFHPPRQEI